SDHFSDGVYIENSDSCDIVRNKFINNFGDGLSLSGGTNAIRIEQNLVQNNSNGINSHSKESDILNNTIIQNKGRGITLGWDTEGVNLVNNMISYNYEAAIRIKDATSSNLLNNSISNNCLSSDSSSGAIELRRSNQLTLSYNHLRNNLGWAVYIEETSWSELDHNLIENNTLGFFFDGECFSNRIKRNVFKNNLNVNMVPSLSISQIYDNAGDYSNDELNDYLLNHFNDWTSPDEDKDGIVDLPYLIDGYAETQDNFPIVDPSQPIENRIRGTEVVHPNGGEVLSGTVSIGWKGSFLLEDNQNSPIYYKIYLSDDAGSTWNEFSLLDENSIWQTSMGLWIEWNTTNHYDGSNCLIKVFAYTPDNLFEEDISDSTFSIINGRKRPPHPAIRILMFLVVCSLIGLLIKKNRT
ncbi:MAG: right-handed parallel beta-helix repeat-containing protein, partial [Candidatus Hodarchaeales archaeon]